MNNKKRPAVSDNTLTRRYSRRINNNNNVEQIASLDDYVDDIILSIASYLTSCELFNFALTCKRFGAREGTTKENDIQQNDINESNTILSNGSRVFARPSSNGTRVLQSNYHQELPSNERSRKVMFHEGVITEHSFTTESYRVEFKNGKLKLNGNNKQWIHQSEVVSIEDMTKRVEQSLRYCGVKMEGHAIYVSHYIMVDKQRWGIRPSFIKDIGSSSLERVRLQIESRDWSLMEEAALRKLLNLLTEEGYLMWREGGSWIDVCHQFEKELNRLAEEDCELEKEEPNETDATDLVSLLVKLDWVVLVILPAHTFLYQDHFLDEHSEMSEYIGNDIAEVSSSRDSTATNFFQLYSNTSSKPLKECHMRGVGTMVGLFENGISGVLINDGMG